MTEEFALPLDGLCGGTLCFEASATARAEAAAPPPWPLAWQEGLRCFPKKKKIGVEKAAWSVVTLSVDLPNEISVFLNGERVVRQAGPHALVAAPTTAACGPTRAAGGHTARRCTVQGSPGGL